MTAQPKSIPLILALLIGIFFLLIVGVGSAALMVSQSTQCGTGGSSFLDVWRAQSFGLGVFSEKEWQKSYSVEPYRVQVVWDSPDLGSVATLEYLLFNCGTTSADLDVYYSDENFHNIILADYQDVQKTSACRAGETRLYQFTAKFENADYLLWQWVKPDGAKRVFGFFMAVPTQSRLSGLGYAEKVFPELTTCP